MVVKVRRNGEIVRAYVGTTKVDHTDPIDMALGTLREQCKDDLRRKMSEFRWWTYRRTDVFGLRAETAARQAQEARRAWEAAQ